jgi:tetratricopeptide (TPR) repeat protein
VYLELGQNDLAYSYVEKAILLTEEKDGRYIDTRGEVLMTMGKLNDALNDFTRASVLMPKESEPFEHRALCYRKLAEKEQDSGKQTEWIAKAEADEEKAKSLRDK